MVLLGAQFSVHTLSASDGKALKAVNCGGPCGLGGAGGLTSLAALPTLPPNFGDKGWVVVITLTA